MLQWYYCIVRYCNGVNIFYIHFIHANFPNSQISDIIVKKKCQDTDAHIPNFVLFLQENKKYTVYKFV